MQSVQMEDVFYPSWRASNPSDSRRLSTTTEMSSKSECRVVTGTNVRHGSSRSTQGRQRLAGRTTRIRLEGVPTPSSGMISNKEKTSVPDGAPFANNSATSFRPPAVEKIAGRSVDTDEETTDLRIPVVEKKQYVEKRAFVDDVRETSGMRLPVVEKAARQSLEEQALDNFVRETSSMRLPAVEKVVRRREEPSPTLRSGTGLFECGQRDVMISDSSVAASSVVLVILTVNPGPVVVQYVSLQPRIGFTVHLTAPATISVPFNYIVL
jgi:hypothetical protein